MRAGKPAIVERPGAAAERASTERRAIGADLWLARARLQLLGRQAAVGLGGRGRALRGPGLSGAARRQPAAQCLGRAGRARGVARAPADQAQAVRNGLRWSSCRGASRSCRAADAGARRRAQPARGRRAGAQPRRRWAFIRARTPCSARWRDKDIAAMLARMAPLVDRWYFTDLPTPRAASAAQLPAQWQAPARRGRDGDASTHADPMRALPRRWPLRTPLIESSSSARSTPSAACWRTGLPARSGRHLS